MNMFLPVRIRSALIHLLICLFMALMAGLVVFKLWFPSPYNDFAGGTKLFVILISVDVMIGPLLTFVVFNPSKTRRHLMMDVGVIAILQLAALAYGLHTVSQARPVVLAAENKMFRVVTANSVMLDELAHATQGFQSLSWTGPRLVGVRRSANGQEMMRSVELALQGYDVGTRPSYWQPYDKSRSQVVQQAQLLEDMARISLAHQRAVADAARSVGRQAKELCVLPLLARQTGWYVLLDRKTGDVLGFARLDPDVAQ